MTKVRIPVNQVDKYKSFCKLFSHYLEAGTDIRLRGNVLLNTIARAAGHDSHTALLRDAGIYGNGPFRSELLPHQLAAPLAAQLDLQPMQVQFMLGSARVDAYADEIADAICETVQSNPLAGATPALLPLPDSESRVWDDMSKCYLSSLAKTGAGQLPPDSGADRPEIDFKDALRQIGAVKTGTDKLSAGESDTEAPFPVFLSDSGLSIEDEVSLTESFKNQNPGALSFMIDETPMPWVSPTLRQVLDKGKGE